MLVFGRSAADATTATARMAQLDKKTLDAFIYLDLRLRFAA
jgi:hypothetical protein